MTIRRMLCCLMAAACLWLLPLFALAEGDTEEVSITIFDESGNVIIGDPTPEPETTPEPEVTPEPTPDPALPVYQPDGSILLRIKKQYNSYNCDEYMA